MAEATKLDDSPSSETVRGFLSKWRSVTKKFKVFLDSMADAIILTDETGQIVLANLQAEKLFGYSRGELFSQQIELLVPISFRKEHVGFRNSYVNNPYPRPMESRQSLFGLRKDGSEFLTEISLSPMQTKSGLLVCAAIRDISSRRNSERVLQLVVEGTSLTFGNDYFRSLVRHLAHALEVRRAFISEIHDNKFRLLASWHGNDFEQNYEYDSAGTPCEHVIEKGLVFYSRNVQQFFPQDQWLIDFNIESYLAISLLDLDGIPIGLLGIAHDEPLPEMLASHSIFQAISTRTGAELLRMRAEKSLKIANNELEDRVKERTEALEILNEHYRTEMVIRKRTEEDLRRTHEELNNILDSIPNFLWSADVDDQNNISYRYYSPVVEDITGRSPEFFMKDVRAWQSIIHPNDKMCVKKSIGRILSRQSIREEEEYRILLPDGAIRWVRDNVLVTSLENDCLRLDGVVGDITDRIAFENALRESEEQVRLLLDSTVEAIYGLDLKGNCTFCNRACLETLGYKDAEELLGQNMHDLIHHTRIDGSPYPVKECKIHESFRLGKGTHVDDEVLWKANGNSFPAEYRSLPMHRHGELVGSVVTFLDITEQKRVETELRQKQSELTHAARMSTLGEMAAGLAHEINQPLTAMSAFAEGALVRLDRGGIFSKEEVTSLFSKIAEDSQRAGNIIRRLRNFVQKREAQRVQINLNPLIKDVFQLLESDAKHQSITIKLDLAENLAQIVVDPIEIQQVLLNLIRNACDAISQCDSPNRNIVITSFQNKPGRVEVVVEDSGPGIPRKMVSQVFEPFYTSKAEGLGIGLGICKNIIESHRGTIWLGESSIGGASVHFDFPSYQQESEINAM